MVTPAPPGRSSALIPAVLALSAALGGAGAARATDASVPLCQIDAADPHPGPAWMRANRLLERVRAACAPGDVLWLFAYDRTGHLTDPATVAPLICRFDHQILLHAEDNDGPRRLACVYAGGTRSPR